MASARELILVDTNVVLYSVIESPLRFVFEPYAAGRVSTISFQSVAELRFLALRRGWGPRLRQRLQDRLDLLAYLEPTPDIIERWAELMFQQVRIGSRVETADGWIAATALAYDCPILTNDRKDFERIEGLQFAATLESKAEARSHLRQRPLEDGRLEIEQSSSAG